jgi:hypothetical protein
MLQTCAAAYLASMSLKVVRRRSDGCSKLRTLQRMGAPRWCASGAQYLRAEVNNEGSLQRAQPKGERQAREPLVLGCFLW